VLGDWEGAGPDGLPLSFTLVRLHHKLAIRDLTVGDPLLCPGRLAPTNATPYPECRTSAPARHRSSA
jgi:hypothetical protein